MSNKKPSKKHTENYVKFLEKRVQSNNYRNNVSDEEYQKTVDKLKKEKFRLKNM